MKPRPVPDAIGAAPMHRLTNGGCAIPFTGVHGHGQIVLSGKVEGGPMHMRGVSAFTSRQIKGYHTPSAVRDRELRHLHGVRPRE